MTFQTLNLIEQLQRAVTKEGYVTPTPIQAKAIPHVLEGKDLMGIAQTGTGKTAAFVLPILQRMTQNPKHSCPLSPRVLVLAPTRELAAQIDQSFRVYGQFLRYKQTVIFGGVGQDPQVKSIQHGIDILIATPGRLLDLIGQGYIKLSNVEFLVLDEADRMLDMGFIHDVRRIISILPHKRQSLFFSATMSPQVGDLAARLLTNPIHVEVAPQATTVELVKQHVFFVNQEDKSALLLNLLKHEHLECVLIFTRTKSRANKLTRVLLNNGIKADAIHGNKSQNHRTKALHDFKSGHLRVLVATDIAARGIDIDDISHVINYDLPNEPQSYVHRIGRTARAGAEGTSYSFCAADERNYLHDIERLIRMKIDEMNHKFHSEHAKNATGDAARPPPKQHWGGSRPFEGKFGREKKHHNASWSSHSKRRR